MWCSITPPLLTILIYIKSHEKGWGRKKEENVKEGIIWFFWYISMWDGKGVAKKRKRKMWKKSLFGSFIYLDVRRAMREIWDSFFFFLRKKKYLISKYQWGYNWKNHSLKKQKFQKRSSKWISLIKKKNAITIVFENKIAWVWS